MVWNVTDGTYLLWQKQETLNTWYHHDNQVGWESENYDKSKPKKKRFHWRNSQWLTEWTPHLELAENGRVIHDLLGVCSITRYHHDPKVSHYHFHLQAEKTELSAVRSTSAFLPHTIRHKTQTHLFSRITHTGLRGGATCNAGGVTWPWGGVTFCLHHCPSTDQGCRRTPGGHCHTEARCATLRWHTGRRKETSTSSVNICLLSKHHVYRVRTRSDGSGGTTRTKHARRPLSCRLTNLFVSHGRTQVGVFIWNKKNFFMTNLCFPTPPPTITICDPILGSVEWPAVGTLVLT